MTSTRDTHDLPAARPGAAIHGEPEWLDEFVRTADARERGLEAELRQLVRHGELVPVAHGVARWRQAAHAARARGEHPRDDGYRALVRASMIVAPPATAVAGPSAALLWGMSTLAPWPERAVHLRPPTMDTHSSRWVDRSAGSADIRDVVDGMPVTSPARTVVDVARMLPRATAFALAATALYQPSRGAPIAQLSEVLAELHRIGPSRGVRAARAIAMLVGDGCQSAAEAISLMLMLDLGFERPQQQVEFRDAEGRMIVDAYWPSVGLVGECDGRSKYLRDDVGDGRAASHAVVDEKLREDRLRALGLTVVRWTTETLRDPRAFAVLLETAGVPRRRRGRVRRTGSMGGPR